MELLLIRTYHPKGTNGLLCSDGQLICNTIELPWLQNLPGVSCIPEGRYLVKKRYSQKFRWHLHLTDVPGRELILVHPANHALKELKGCIAPVTQIIAAGQGTGSRLANGKLIDITDPAFQKEESLFITIRALETVPG
ncbi:MAG: DUF5675 family protein [Bacteroidota bacterium]